MTFQPFVVDYDSARGGMWPLLNGDPMLVKELENLGIGMEVEGPWAAGGPFVWKRVYGTIAIGWIRALAKAERDRAGACKAWGIEASPDEEIRWWPAFWETLRSEPPPQTLINLADSMRSAATSTLPVLKQAFAGLLSEAYRKHAAGNDKTFVIPLESPEDIPALAWFWLLGPTDPTCATVGPPRRELAAVAPRLTYAGQIDNAVREFHVSPYIAEQIFAALRHGDLTGAVKAADDLRRTPPRQLLSKLEPPPSRPKNDVWNREGAMGVSTSHGGRAGAVNPARGDSAVPVRSIWSALRDWLVPALSIIQMLLLFLILGLLMQQRKPAPVPEVPTATLPAANTTTTATDTNTTTAATTTTATTSSEPLPEVSGVAFLSGLRQSGSDVKFGGMMAQWMKVQPGNFSRNDVARARTAALQLYMVRHQCAKATNAIDGVIGPAFYDGIYCLARKGDSLDVLKSDQALIDWLQAPH